MNLHPIRTRRSDRDGQQYSRGHKAGYHEGWQAGWNAALLTQPAQQNPVPLANSEHLTTTTGSGGGGYAGGYATGPTLGGQGGDGTISLRNWNNLCTGRTKAGHICKLPVTPGTNTCHHHRSGASIGPSYGPDDRIVTSATVGSGGGQTHSGGNGGSDQGVPIGGSASNVQPMADPYEEAKKRRTAYRKSQLDRANGLCTGTTHAGTPCQLPVTPGTNTCHHHRTARNP